ncbi:MAG: AI-2E family transporter [bacterium]
MALDGRNQSAINVDISILSIVKIIVVLLFLWFVYAVKEIFGIIFVALILASAFDPWVDWMQKKKIPRGLGILLIYLILILFLSLIVILLIPPVTEQIQELSSNMPHYLSKLSSGFESLKQYSIENGLLGNLQKFLGSAGGASSAATGGVFSAVTGIFGGIVSFFLILVLTLYITVEESAMKRAIRFIAPDKYQPYIIQLINRIQNKIGRWLRGQLVLCVIIALLAYIGLLILNVKYALVLALIAGIFELIPYLGPILGAIPAVLLAFTQSPIKALLVIILYFVIQQLENNLIVPKVMQKAVGLNPIISIVALLIGAKLGGVVGALLAIPLTTAIGVFAKDFFANRAGDKDIKEEEEEA